MTLDKLLEKLAETMASLSEEIKDKRCCCDSNIPRIESLADVYNKLSGKNNTCNCNYLVDFLDKVIIDGREELKEADHDTKLLIRGRIDICQSIRKNITGELLPKPDGSPVITTLPE